MHGVSGDPPGAGLAPGARAAAAGSATGWRGAVGVPGDGEPAPPLDTVHVVAHTHWDREWYRTAEEFRLSLVPLVDEVLDGAAPLAFLLDGQAIVLLDYLAVRPERRDTLAAALASGRMEAGPWFVLGDNLIPSGEALVRNLLAGREVLRGLGAAPPPVLYCPDAFGHPAALPRLAAGFGAGVVVVWRGYGGTPWPPGDSARWRGDDGSAVLLLHLAPDGYELGANLPADAPGAAARWASLRATLAPRTTLGIALLPNGADHHALQERRAEALRALALAAAPVRVADGTLGQLGAALRARAAGRRLPVVRGELRWSPDHAWSLQGTCGSRAAQKRANARAERLLVHLAEPLAALAEWRDGVPRGAEVRAIWRTLLSCHPHDTLCGCSRDEVAQAMDARLGEVMRGGALAARRALLGVLGHDPVRARDAVDRWRPVVAVWNPLPRPRGGIAELEVDVPLGVVPVGPASAGATLPGAPPGSWRLGDGSVPVQEVARERLHVREESPRHYPRNLLVERRRVLAWLPELRGMEAATLPLRRGRARAAPVPDAVTVERRSLANGRCRVWVDEGSHGLRLMLAAPDGAVLADCLALEVVGDRGDLYTHSPIPGSQRLGEIAGVRVVERGPLRGTLQVTMRSVVPAREVVTATGARVRRRASTLRLTVLVQLTAGSPLVTFVVRGDHAAPDARVRLRLATGIAAPDVWADAAFGPVARPPLDVQLAGTMGRAREAAVPTAPLHRYVSLYAPDRGASVLGDGLAEYQAGDDGTVAVTLVRAVGDLSRHDLPERPGHAGWPVATPQAQSPGPYEARLGLLLHGPRTEATRVAVHEAAESWLLPIVGDTWGSAVSPPARVPGLALGGEGLAFSSCKPADDGQGIVVRAINLLDRPVTGCWTLGTVREAWLARLDETPLGALPVRDGRVVFHAPSRATVTIRLAR